MFYRLALALLIATPLGVLAALTLAKAQVASDIAALEEEVGPKIRSEARARSLAAAELVLQPIASRPPATSIVAALAGALPQSATLRSLTVDDNGKVHTTVAGASAVSLQAALAPAFHSVTAFDDTTSQANLQSGVTAAFPTPQQATMPLVTVEIRP